MSNRPHRCGARRARGSSARRPPWTIIGVCPTIGDEPFPPFMYTVGLHLFGLPELHLDTGGSEAGVLPTRFAATMINVIAQRCIDGTVGPGAVVTEQTRGEFAAIVFTLGVPSNAHRDPLQAFQTDPCALIMPVSWIGEPRP